MYLSMCQFFYIFCHFSKTKFGIFVKMLYICIVNINESILTWKIKLVS
jgi:hypothetical protein